MIRREDRSPDTQEDRQQTRAAEEADKYRRTDSGSPIGIIITFGSAITTARFPGKIASSFRQKPLMTLREHGLASSGDAPPVNEVCESGLIN